MMRKNKGIYAFWGPSWVLITMVPRKYSTSKYEVLGDRSRADSQFYDCCCFRQYVQQK